MPAAKIASIAKKLITGLKELRAAGKLLDAWNRLGGSNGERFATLLSQLRTAVDLIAKHGWDQGLTKLASYGGRAKQAGVLIKGGIGVLAELLGLGACYDLATARY